MPQILPNGYFVAAFHFQVSGSLKQVITTQAFFSATVDTADLILPDVVFAYVGGAGRPFHAAGMPTSLTLTKVSVLYRDGQNLLYAEDLSIVAGSGVFGAMPMNTAPLLRKRTGLSGRKFRSNSFLPPLIREDEISAAGIINEPVRVALQNRFQAGMRPIMTQGGYSPVLLHSDILVAPNVLGPFTVAQKIGTIGRRLR